MAALRFYSSELVKWISLCTEGFTIRVRTGNTWTELPRDRTYVYSEGGWQPVYCFFIGDGGGDGGGGPTTPTAGTPTMINIAYFNDGFDILVEWSASSTTGVTYEVWRSFNNIYELIGTTANRTFIDQSVPNATTFFDIKYKVRATRSSYNDSSFSGELTIASPYN